MPKSANKSDDYFDLIRNFPIVPIRSKKQFEAASRILDQLLKIPEDSLTKGESDYLIVLGNEIADYEEAEMADDLANISEAEIIKHLLDSHDMSASDLGRVLGNRELGSKVLRGERELSKSNILKLAEHFNVDSGLFLRPKPIAFRRKPLAANL